MAARVDLHSAAVRYAARGWAVLPCHTPHADRCSCSKPDCSAPGKHPRLVNGLNGASIDRAAIEQWWNRWPDANIGIRTGEASGLVVVDIDRRSGGDRTLSQLVDQHDKLPSTLAVRTGDGVHLYFAHPGWPVRNDAGRRLGPGIDVRGEGGYVLAPPRCGRALEDEPARTRPRRRRSSNRTKRDHARHGTESRMLTPEYRGAVLASHDNGGKSVYDSEPVCRRGPTASGIQDLGQHRGHHRGSGSCARSHPGSRCRGRPQTRRG